MEIKIYHKILHPLTCKVKKKIHTHDPHDFCPHKMPVTCLCNVIGMLLVLRQCFQAYPSFLLKYSHFILFLPLFPHISLCLYKAKKILGKITSASSEHGHSTPEVGGIHPKQSCVRSVKRTNSLSLCSYMSHVGATSHWKAVLDCPCQIFHGCTYTYKKKSEKTNFVFRVFSDSGCQPLIARCRHSCMRWPICTFCFGYSIFDHGYRSSWGRLCGLPWVSLAWSHFLNLAAIAAHSFHLSWMYVNIYTSNESGDRGRKSPWMNTYECGSEHSVYPHADHRQGQGGAGMECEYGWIKGMYISEEQFVVDRVIIIFFVGYANSEWLRHYK
ncbi:hypothetical protein VP01_84g4 [Puccinia sorghi]|uniref:Uncharacterized protein n=1 Tax=Puccinia sorghi TaxID=27349 RepID=A0A0L6U965_9BASI|nr:hypothetical protein VP01_84g4 [Puccinia sorghi]